jgi:hypothetical protein
MHGLESSIHTAPASASGMGLRVKPWDDGYWGWRLAKLGRLTKHTGSRMPHHAPPPPSSRPRVVTLGMAKCEVTMTRPPAPSCSALSRASTRHPPAPAAWPSGQARGRLRLGLASRQTPAFYKARGVAEASSGQPMGRFPRPAPPPSILSSCRDPGNAGV